VICSMWCVASGICVMRAATANFATRSADRWAAEVRSLGQAYAILRAGHVQCLDLLLIRVETHALVDDLIASFAPDVERSLKADDISALREKLTIDLCATIAPSLASKAIQVALVTELRVVPEFRRVIAVRGLSFGHGLLPCLRTRRNLKKEISFCFFI